MPLSYVERFRGLFTGNVASTSTSTGTIVVTGGIGVSGAANTGSVGTGAVAASGSVTMTQGTASTSTGTGTLVVTGGVGVSGAIYSASQVLTGGTASTSTGTGALVVTGGVGVSGAVNSASLGTGGVAASGAVTMTQGTASTSTGSGTLVVTGGVGVSGTVHATQTNTGNIQVAGNTISSTNANGDIVISPNGSGLVKIGANEVATRSYVDASIQGLDVKQSVKVATVAAGTLATSFAESEVVDGYTLVAGDRILIKEQSTASENGIYTVNTEGAPTRAADANTSSEVTAGLFVFIEQGSTLADTGWVLSTNGTITLGTTGLSFVQFSSAGQVTAGDGIARTGNVLSAKLKSNGGLVIESGDIAVDLGAASITGTLAVGDGGTGATTLTGYVYGNATGAMTASATIPGSAITGAMDNVTVGATTRASGAFTTLAANGAVTMTVGTASTSTGTGTLVVTGGVGVSGAVTSGSVGTGAVAASGAVTMTAGTASTSTGTGTLVVTGGVGVSGAVTSGSVGTGALASSGAVTMTAGTASTSTGTGTLVVTGGVGVSGAVTSGSVGTGALASSGAVTMTAGTASTSTGTGTLVVTGGVGVSGAVTSGSVGTGAVAASGAVTMTAGTASTSTGTGTLVVTGGVGVSGQVTAANVAITDGFNTGVSLGENSWSTGELIVRSEIVSLKTVSEYTLFTVPTGYMFLVNTMEIVTTAITSAGTAPSVRFGTTLLPSDYYGPAQITSNSAGARHIIENPQEAAAAGTLVSFGVTTGSTASTHSGCAIVKGYLFKTS